MAIILRVSDEVSLDLTLIGSEEAVLLEANDSGVTLAAESRKGWPCRWKLMRSRSMRRRASMSAAPERLTPDRMRSLRQERHRSSNRISYICRAT